MTFGVQAPGGEQPARGFARSRDEGRRIDLPDWSMLVKVTAGDTLGRLTVLEGRMGPRQPGPLPHVHEGHDETFVLVEGRLRFRVGDGFHTAVAGETVFAGRRLAHGFGNPFDEQARYVATLTPSGYEDYFAEVAEHVARTGAMPGRALTQELMARHRTVLVPPLPDPDAVPPPLPPPLPPATTRAPLERLEAGVAAVVRWSESRHIRAEIARRSGCDAAPSELRLLEFFDLVEPLRISDIAQCLRIDVSTASLQLRQLRGNRLVEAIPVEGDRRASLIAITPKGRATVEKVRAARRDLLRTVFADVPHDDLEQGAELLLRVQAHMLAGMRAKLGGDAPDASDAPDGAASP